MPQARRQYASINGCAALWGGNIGTADKIASKKPFAGKARITQTLIRISMKKPFFWL